MEDVACGSHHSLLLRNGCVFSWGEGSRGELGLGETTRSVDSPQHVRFPDDSGNIVKIAASGRISLALDENGNIYVWGSFGSELWWEPKLIANMDGLIPGKAVSEIQDLCLTCCGWASLCSLVVDAA